MICSMTAFAREESRGETGELAWELRSVNHRYLEAFVRLPEEFRVLEPKIRERLAERLGRGKLDCGLRYKPASGYAGHLSVNLRLVEQLLTAGKEIAEMVPGKQTPGVMDMLAWPGVLEEQERDMGPVQQQAMALLEQALDSLVETRQREGMRLAEIIQQRVASMQQLVSKAKQRMPLVLAGVRERLVARLQEISGDLDETRVEQEIVLLAQRLDVDEEMDRLSTHLDEVARVLETDDPVGRRLDFLMQELNREANTLSSKSSDVEVTQVGVEMKVLIEQMREQIQNIE